MCVVSEERVTEDDVLGRGSCGSSSIVESDALAPKWPITVGRLNRQPDGETANEDIVVVSPSRDCRWVNRDAARLDARLCVDIRPGLWNIAEARVGL